MSTQVTSPEANRGTQSVLAASTLGQWQRFFAFLRRPSLPERATGIRTESLVATGRLLLLDFALVFVLLSALFAAMAAGFEIPETALADMELTAGLVALVVLAAPLGEELVFRSWLSGRPGHVLAWLAVALGAMAVPFIAGLSGRVDPDDTGLFLTAGLGFLAGLVLAGLALWYFRNRGPMRWFAWAFPVILYFGALAFAGIHLLNYEEEVSPLLWLMVLPQFVLGLVVAYARVQYGLWSAILIHALHNGTIIAFVLAAESAGLAS